MGFMDDAKQTAEAVGEKIKDAWEDTTDRAGSIRHRRVADRRDRLIRAIDRAASSLCPAVARLG